MECLEGETLDARVRRGALALDQALEYGIQIADALDQAHRHGIIHRDLKPANVMLTKNGVKLLDFGLAKVLGVEAAAAATSLPTMAQSLTAQGTIMGTFQYMAPEQLEGADADVRSDIFAFGAVLYEMITGRRAFQGKSQASLISAIMSGEPQAMSALQPMAAPALQHVVSTCLAKDPDARWQTCHDVLVQLKWIAEGESQVGVAKPVAARRRHREWFAWAVLLLLLATVSWIHFRELQPAARPAIFSISEPENALFADVSIPVLSPDGQTIAFTGISKDGKRNLWLRRIESLEAHLVPGTDGAVLPFWSPDSQYVAFFADGKLMKMAVAGGPAITLCESIGLGGTWNRQGVILIGSQQTNPILRSVSAAGGEVKVVLSPNPSFQGAGFAWPSFLPDGRHFLYESRSNDTGKSALRLGSLDSKETSVVEAVDSPGWYVPPGYILFVRRNTIFAQPFDAAKLRVSGEAMPVVEGVGPLPSPGYNFSASQTGALAYRGTSLNDLQVFWIDRSGKHAAQISEAGRYRQIALSPDGKHAALERLDPGNNTWDIWVMDLASGILSRLTSDPTDDTDPVWSPDSRQVAFSSYRRGHLDLYRKALGAQQEELVYADGERKVPEWWLKDGTILYTTSTGKDYSQIAPDGDRKPNKLFHADFSTDEPSVSPDGRWVSYNSLESGRWEVYVAAFPGFTDKRQISNNGGAQARWRADAKELFYLSLDGKMMAVDLKTAPAFEAGVPRVLFETHLRVNPAWDQYGVTADGQRFLVAEPVKDIPKPITVILNWPGLIKNDGK